MSSRQRERSSRSGSPSGERRSGSRSSRPGNKDTTDQNASMQQPATRRTRENVKPPVPQFGQGKRVPVKRDTGPRSSTIEHKSEDAYAGAEEDDYENLPSKPVSTESSIDISPSAPSVRIESPPREAASKTLDNRDSASVNQPSRD